jgi:hypothetical protein
VPIERSFGSAAWPRVLMNALTRWECGLPHEAVPVSKFEFGAVSCLAFNVRFGSQADILARIKHVRFTPESGHFFLR